MHLRRRFLLPPLPQNHRGSRTSPGVEDAQPRRPSAPGTGATPKRLQRPMRPPAESDAREGCRVQKSAKPNDCDYVRSGTPVMYARVPSLVTMPAAYSQSSPQPQVAPLVLGLDER
jgi:hypothetical protein